MKVINKQNQHEIGFDIDIIPPWFNFLVKDYFGPWVASINRLKVIDGIWQSEDWKTNEIMKIPKDYEPKKFTGDWEDSLFFIDRSEIANYNGTAI